MSPLPARLALAVLLFSASLHAEAPQGRLATVLQPFVKDQVLAGAVTLVANREQVLDVTTVGSADIATGKPMKSDALFWIASMSKPITAAAFMMLVDEGKVKVDDPVEKYLPEFKGQMVQVEKDANHVLLKKPVHPILIRNVLSHTSGLAFKSAIETPTLDGLPLRVAVASHAMQPLQFEPDSKYQYANAGINTAARIIEVVSGQSYESFMQERLFTPLGMKDTTFWPDEAQVARIAKSYKGNADKSVLEETTVTQLHYPLTDRANRYPMPAGGLFSTASDVAVFCQMLLNGGEWKGRRYLSKASLEMMTSKQTAEGLTGYGFGYSTSNGTFGHGGAYSTNMTIDPAHNLVTVFMVQNAGWRTDAGKGIEGVFRKAAGEMFGK